MKLLVTGGAGYIGSIVARQLLAAGHEVVVLDNLERGHREAVPGRARLVVADLRDREATGRALGEGFDGVLHFAALALVGESVSEPERYYRTNVGGTLNLLDAMVAGRSPSARVLLDLCGLRPARSGADRRGRATASDERVRRVEARRRRHDRRLLRGARPRARSASGTSTSPVQAARPGRTTIPRHI